MEPAARTLLLYAFEQFDLVRRRWTRARHRLELHELGRDGAPFRIIGAPERREVHAASTLTAGHLARGR